MPTQEEKTFAMLAWVLSIPLRIVGPLIFIIIAKDKPFVFSHAIQCLMFDIIVSVALAVFFTVTCGVGLILLPFLILADLIIVVLAVLNANNGLTYEPPVTGPPVKKWFNLI